MKQCKKGAEAPFISYLSSNYFCLRRRINANGAASNVNHASEPDDFFFLGSSEVLDETELPVILHIIFSWKFFGLEQSLAFAEV